MIVHKVRATLKGEIYTELIWAVNLNQLSPGARCHLLLLGLKQGRSLSGRAECSTFPTIYETIMVKSLAQGLKCHDQDSNPHTAADETRAWDR